MLFLICYLVGEHNTYDCLSLLILASANDASAQVSLVVGWFRSKFNLITVVVCVCVCTCVCVYMCVCMCVYVHTYNLDDDLTFLYQ